jgi:ABC-2 type transport system permease protein
MRVIDLAVKDLYQIVRDWKAALFLLVMPIAFTLLLGYVFRDVDGGGDARLPVGVLDLEDGGGALSPRLLDLMEASDAIRPVVLEEGDTAEAERRVADEELAAAVIVPQGYGERVLEGELVDLPVIVDPASVAGTAAQRSVQAAATRLMGAVQIARLGAEAYDEEQEVVNESDRQGFLQGALGDAVAAWEDPLLTVEMTASGESDTEEEGPNSFAHSSPAMMVQFTIAGLIGAAEVLVLERRSGALRRLLTTAISRLEIILGHYLAMVLMIFAQVAILIVFGQLAVGVEYARTPLATLLVAAAMALWVASLGLLIGVVAKTEEQVVIFSMIPMFVLSALGGAWMPLEGTSETFQAIGHVLPSAWAMDGFKNLVIRGLGFSSVLVPAGIMLAYAVVLFALALWRFEVE